MTDFLNRKVVSLCIQKNRELIRKSLAAGNYSVSFLTFLGEAEGAINELKPSVYIHDWLAVDESQTRKFHLTYSRSSQAKNVIRVLLVPEISPSMLAFANDAGIERVLSYGAASLNLANELDMLTASHDQNELAKFVRAIKSEEFKYDQSAIDGHVEELYRKFPHDPKVKLEFGNLSFRQEKIPEALILASDIVSREPQNVRAINLMGRALMKQGEWDKAMEVLEGANILSPSNPERLIMIGNACYGKGDLTQALASYSKAIDLDAEMHPIASRQMGQIKLEMGHVEDALDLFKNSVSEDEAAGFFNNAAVAAVRDQKPEQALKLYETALKALKTDRLKALIFFNIGLSHRRLGQFEPAFAAFKKSLYYDSGFEKSRQQMEQMSRSEAFKKSS